MKLELIIKPALISVLLLCLLPVSGIAAEWKTGDLNTGELNDVHRKFIQQVLDKGYFAIHGNRIYSGQQELPGAVMRALPTPPLPEGVVLGYQPDGEQIQLISFHAPDHFQSRLNNISLLAQGNTRLIRHEGLRQQIDQLLQRPSQVVIDRRFYYTSSTEVPVTTQQIQNALINNLQHPPNNNSALRVATVNSGQLTPFVLVDTPGNHNADQFINAYEPLNDNSDANYSTEGGQYFYHGYTQEITNPVARWFIESLLNTGYVVIYDRTAYFSNAVADPQQLLSMINEGSIRPLATRDHVRVLTLNDHSQIAWLNLAVPAIMHSSYNNYGQLTVTADNILNLQSTYALAAEVIQNYLNQGYMVIFQGRLYSLTDLVLNPQYIYQLYANAVHASGMINTENTLWVFMHNGSIVTHYVVLDLFEQLPWPRITQLPTSTTQRSSSGFDAAYQPSSMQLSPLQTQALLPTTHQSSPSLPSNSDYETTEPDHARLVNDAQAALSRLSASFNEYPVIIPSAVSGQPGEEQDHFKQPRPSTDSSEKKTSDEEDPNNQDNSNEPDSAEKSAKQKEAKLTKRTRKKSKKNNSATPTDKAYPANSWPHFKYYLVPAVITVFSAIGAPLFYAITNYLQQNKPVEEKPPTSADNTQQERQLNKKTLPVTFKNNNHEQVDNTLKNELDFIKSLMIQKEKIKQELSDPVLSELTEKLFDHMPAILKPVIHRKGELFDAGLFKTNVKTYRNQDYKKPDKALHFIPLKKINTFEQLTLKEKKEIIELTGALINQSLGKSGLDIFTTFQWHMALCGKPEKLSGLPCHKRVSKLLIDQWHNKPSSEALLVSYTKISDHENKPYWLTVAAWPVSGINKLESEPLILPVLNDKRNLRLIERSTLSQDAIRSLDLSLKLQIEPERELLNPSLTWQKVRPMDLLGSFFNYETLATRLLLSDGRIRYNVLYKGDIVPPHKALIPYVTESKAEIPCYLLGDKAAELCVKISGNLIRGNAFFDLLSKFPDFKIPQYQLVTEDNNGNIKLTSSSKDISERIQDLHNKPNKSLFFAFKSLTRLDEVPASRIETILKTYTTESIIQNRQNSLEESLTVLSICGYIPLAGLLEQCYKQNYNGLHETNSGVEQIAFQYLKDGLPVHYSDLEGHHVRYLPLIITSSEGFFFFPVGQLIVNGRPANFIWDNKAGTDKVIHLPFNPSLPVDHHQYVVINAPDVFQSFHIGQPQEFLHDQVGLKEIPETATYLTMFPGTSRVTMTSYFKGQRIRELGQQDN
ncbi:hypothetical protein NX722_25875 [Endozoicomonas gorgoniicola]|uniref:Uncharacterized protein n=1 Tax=Endozoicomonas gorgoniicola TaxID=1234144 RepID=A0ABT3N2Y8_9GAMM|nr:hypothetical protein [Endozoicomonas gorgoniicola]MCW7555995.1 hypothetical protein [Endozoicomonas gorgoniicola]